MTTYLLSIYVTFEQEAVIRKVFKDRNWTFRKLGLQPHNLGADADQFVSDVLNNDFTDSKPDPEAENDHTCQTETSTTTNDVFSRADQSNSCFMSTEKPSHHEHYSRLDTSFIKTEDDSSESCEDDSLVSEDLKGSEETDRGQCDKINFTFPVLKSVPSLPFANENYPDSDVDKNRHDDKKSSDKKNLAKHERKTANQNTEIETHLSCVQPTQEACKNDIFKVKKKSLSEHTVKKRKKVSTKQKVDSTGEKCDKPNTTCTGCGTTYKTVSALKKHLRNDRCVAANNVCPICGKIFRKYEHEVLKVHIRQHNGEQPYKCEVCGKSFAGKSYLDRHVLSHSQDTPYFCTACKMQFRCKQLLRSHNKNMHEDRTKTFQCDICGKFFRHKGSLTQHYKTVHVTEKLIQCDLCDKTFKTKHNLRIHKVIHSKESKHMCNVCGKTFKRRPAFIAHMRIHSGEKPFKCTECDYRSSFGGNLTIHMRIHSGEKPYKCSRCSYSCSSSGNLNKHMKVHDKETIWTDLNASESAMKDEGPSQLAGEASAIQQVHPGEITQSVELDARQLSVMMLPVTFKESDDQSLLYRKQT